MIIALNGKTPSIDPSAFVAPTATIIGDVTIGPEVSIWFGAVLRGDEGRILIGARSNVQDNVTIHVNAHHDTRVDPEVTIGHGVVMEACHIGSGSLIGMNATVLSGAVIGQGVLVAANALVREDQRVPAHHLAAGVPSRVVSGLSDAQRERIADAPDWYVRRSREYLEGLKIVLP